jgi:CHAD domain-containing protein
MDKELLTYINNKLSSDLKKMADAFEEKIDVDTIHKFRVGYKKARAFTRMIALQNGTKTTIKISKELKTSYKIAGLIRDIQLQQQRIIETTKKGIKKPIAYLNLLNLHTEKLKKELSNPTSNNLNKKVCSSKTEVITATKFSTHKFRSFVKQRWDTVHTILKSGNYSDTNLHLIRKNLKDIFFNLKIYEKATPEKSLCTSWRGKDEAFFVQILAMLGSFQDKCTGIDFLKTSNINGLNENNLQLLKQIKTVWIKEKKILKKALLHQLKIELLQQ